MRFKGVNSSFANVVAVVAIAVAAGCDGSPSYRSFIARDRNYYARIADACEELRTHAAPSGADGRKLLPADVALPGPIRSLHPEYLRVSTNRVSIAVGVGRNGYGVIWEHFDSTPAWWRLTAVSENLERVLFTKIEYFQKK